MLGGDLAGAWELVSMENRSDGGSVTFPWGREAIGRIIYTADGWMAVYIAKANRQHFVAGDIYGGTAEELVSAAHRWASYCGRYVYANGVVTHHVEMSFFPNWVGNDQRRYVQLEGDTLTLSTDPILLDSEIRTAKLVWKHASETIDREQ